VDERAKQSLDAISRLLDRTTPWLSEIGSWIFGGLVAVNLVVTSALLTVGPVDAAIRISVTLFACAFPMDVAGIVVLRLTKDLLDFGVDDLALQAFKESGFPEIDAYFPPAPERAALLKRRSGVALRYSLGIAVLSIVLTLGGMVAALWHMAWWIGCILVVMVVLSAGFVLVVFAHAQPPGSAWEKTLKKRVRQGNPRSVHTRNPQSAIRNEQGDG
jgi:hypothetical protein